MCKKTDLLFEPQNPARAIMRDKALSRVQVRSACVRRRDLEVDRRAAGRASVRYRCRKQQLADAARALRRCDVKLFEPRGPTAMLERPNERKIRDPNDFIPCAGTKDHGTLGMRERTLNGVANRHHRSSDVMLAQLRSKMADDNMRIGRSRALDNYCGAHARSAHETDDTPRLADRPTSHAIVATTTRSAAPSARRISAGGRLPSAAVTRTTPSGVL